ncbi:hypothetical protein Q5P01_017840 [Channa striata]|uniref:Uncharacterized protein n=1 Tax=Channa striata TaxID=64152 RepID=A0AA88MEK8_CHASR|nr:hypothetical protein Q5P01_017840 [Channa striata]
MAASEQLLEQMFSWLQQRESCAQQLREAASRIELSVTTSAAAASAQSLLPSDIMNDTHNVDRKREEISDTIQQLFEQLKTAMMEKAVGSVFARPEQMEHWKDLVERNHLSEASQSLKETADNITKTSRTLKGQFHHVRRMLEEMTVNSEHTRSRIEQESPDHLLGAEQLTARKRSSRDKVRNKQDEEEQTEDEATPRTDTDSESVCSHGLVWFVHHGKSFAWAQFRGNHVASSWITALHLPAAHKIGDVMPFRAIRSFCGTFGAATAVGNTIASLAPTHRQCTIEIQNNSCNYTLMTPRIYTESGSCEKPLPAVIGVSSSGSALFVKTPHTACGSVGVFTYDLYHHPSKQNRGKMAVMFSNPYDFNLYSNWFAVGVFDMSKQCDHDLYKEMYNNKEKGFVRGQAKCGCLNHTSHAVTIRATMGDSYQPVIKVQVFDN